MRTGDIIVSVNGAPPFTDGYLSPGVFYLLYQSYPQQQPVRITLRWPVTGATRTVTITPAAYPAPASPVTSKLLDGDIGGQPRHSAQATPANNQPPTATEAAARQAGSGISHDSPKTAPDDKQIPMALARQPHSWKNLDEKAAPDRTAGPVPASSSGPTASRNAADKRPGDRATAPMGT